MRTVFRYELALQDRATVRMQLPAQILHAAASRTYPDVVDLWAVVDPSEREVVRDVLVVGTGREIPVNAGEHIATVAMHGGVFIWHLFEAAVV